MGLHIRIDEAHVREADRPLPLPPPPPPPACNANHIGCTTYVEGAFHISLIVCLFVFRRIFADWNKLQDFIFTRPRCQEALPQG